VIIGLQVSASWWTQLQKVFDCFEGSEDTQSELRCWVEFAGYVIKISDILNVGRACDYRVFRQETFLEIMSPFVGRLYIRT
jgi:hypothetical protein